MHPQSTLIVPLPRIMGVYALTHTATSKQYIGASIHIYERWREHQCELKGRRHPNVLLQQVWDADGPTGLTLSILEIVTDRGTLWTREAFWLNAVRPAFNGCLSMRHCAVSPEAFWGRIDRSGGPESCWPWLGKLSTDGYGIYRRDRRKHYAHRSAWIATHGPIPAGQHVLHSCDARYVAGNVTYRRCCNPADLFLGTQADNVADMMAKGRSRKVRGDDHWTRQTPGHLPYGEAHHKAKLTAEQVRDIRRRYAAGGVSQPALARAYGVRHSLIWAILKRRIWRHIED